MSADKKVVLAYSGGLDTTCILFWLKEKGYKVIAYLADIGQDEDFAAIKKQALSLGAIDAVVENREREFVEEFIYPALSFGTIYQERYLLGTSLARPCITKGIVELAKREKVDFIAHGATGKGNDQVRFELTAASIAPNIKVIAPWRLPEFYDRFKGRKDLLEYAAKNGFTTPATAAKPYSVDSNLMHISYESGILEKPINRPNEDMFAWTKSLEAKVESIQSKLLKEPRSDDLLSMVSNFLKELKPTDIELKISAGIATSLHVGGSSQPVTDSVQIIKTLNDIGAQHGVGRIDIVEDRFIGMKSRGVYETPGGTILFTAIQDLQALCLDKEVNKIRQNLAAQFAEKVYNGLWFSPEGLYLKSCLAMSQKLVSGTVKLSIFAGRTTVTGRSADKSLYDEDLVSMDVQGNFTPTDAAGFIRTQAIRLNAFNQVHKTNPYQ